MKDYLQKDAFIFSGMRTHAQLAEAHSLLRNEKGEIRPYYQFEQDILKINDKYNRNYLEAEYLFAKSSAQSAANWANYDDDTGRYLLQYRTAGDERVRDSHVALDGTTLPKDANFWLNYYPPNGWRCRCTVVEVRAARYTATDEAKAIKEGEKATTQIGKNGKNRLEMFRFNPGKEKRIFPKQNAYSKVVGVNKINIQFDKPLESIKDLNAFFEKFAEDNKEYFSRGFNKLKITNQKSVNGFTDMNGTIALKPEIIENCISALNNIRLGAITTLEQEISLSTLHHEILHNANKIGNLRMTNSQIKTMELANEFVARKTLPDFLKKIGGELQNVELTNNRTNTGYNRMVRNYDNLIKWSECEEKKVLNDVKKHLIEKSYTEQITGLKEAIKNNSKYIIKDEAISKLIELAKDDRYTENIYNELLIKNKSLLVDRL